MNKPDEAEVSDDVTEARVRRSLGLSANPPPHSGHNNHSHSGHNNHSRGGNNTHSGQGNHGGSASSNGPSGNGAGGGIQRRRFVRDGEVPVVIVHPKSEIESRHAAALADLTRQRDNERSARLRAEQSLHEAQATIQSLQTRIAHTEMARTEAVASATQVEPTPSFDDSPDLAPPAFALQNPLLPDRPRRGRPEKPPEPEEPTPVKWWR